MEKALYDGSILFSRDEDQALRDVNDAVIKIMHHTLSEKELLNAPEMQAVRQKSAKAWELVNTSDGSESTVEIIE